MQHYETAHCVIRVFRRLKMFFIMCTACVSRGKGEVHPTTGHEGPEGGKDIGLVFL